MLKGVVSGELSPKEEHLSSLESYIEKAYFSGDHERVAKVLGVFTQAVIKKMFDIEIDSGNILTLIAIDDIGGDDALKIVAYVLGQDQETDRVCIAGDSIVAERLNYFIADEFREDAFFNQIEF